MSGNPFHFSSGIAYADDLKLVTEVFDRICKDYGFQKDSLDAQEIGHAAMTLFSSGVSTETKLLAGLHDLLHRKNWIGAKQPAHGIDFGNASDENSLRFGT